MPKQKLISLLKGNKCFAPVAVFVAICGLGGCSTGFVKPQRPMEPRIIIHAVPASKPRRQNITQVSRYSSVTNGSTRYQKNPLLAISQFKFGPRVKTVGQALWQVLQDTGYSLVPDNQLPNSVKDVLTKPLPVTQRELGPISVGDALRTLMGEQVFTLVVDPVHRLVTFKLKPKFSHFKGVR